MISYVAIRFIFVLLACSISALLILADIHLIPFLKKLHQHKAHTHTRAGRGMGASVLQHQH